MKRLVLLVAVLFALSNIASAAIITSVNRSGGASGNRDPVGVYDGEMDPLPSDPGGLANGVLVFSDRTYPYSLTPIELVGAEYIRTFNSDKNNASTVTYTVTTSSASFFAVGIDDRWDTQQTRIDGITSLVGPAGTFFDTGLTVYIHENDTTDRPLSIFMAELPAGTYTFNGTTIPSSNNFMVMGAIIPEPATIALLGFGTLALIRKKR